MSPPHVVATLLLLLGISAPAATETTTHLEELIALRSRSNFGVIRLDDHLVDRFLSSSPTPRPYSLLIFFDATLARSNPELNLAALRSDFALVSTAFGKRNPNSTAFFFCDVEYSQSPKSFENFNITSLPHIRLVGPKGRTSPAGSEAVPQAVVQGKAEAMAEFVEARTGLPVGSIERPPPVSVWWFVVGGLFVAASVPFGIRKVLRGETILTDKRLWMVSALLIYFFGVSGCMHGVIRQMPLALPDQDNPSRFIFFYQGSDAQLGAEGIAVGFLYTAVGVILALVTHSLVQVEDVSAQKITMVSAMIVSFWAVMKVVNLDNWKTGYSVSFYWPSGWR